MTKWHKIIVVALLVTLIGLLISFKNKKDQIDKLTVPTPISKENWQTFISKKYGYSIMHPKNLIPTETDPSRTGDQIVFYHTTPGEFGECGSYHEGISVSENSVESETNWRSYWSTGQYVAARSEGKIGGEKAQMVETTEMGRSLIRIIHKDRVFTIDSQGGMLHCGMLSTLKFLD